MLEPFLINPPRRRFRSNPLGVDDLVILNPPARKKRAKKRSKPMASVRRKRNKKGRFVKGSAAPKRRRRRTTVHRKVSAPKRRRRAVSRRKGIRAHTIRRHSVYISNPRRGRRRYRRNPLGISTASIMPTLKEGAMIAAGAIVVGNAMSYIPYVNTLTGVTRHAARLGVAIAGGMVIGKYVSPSLGRAFAMGGVVVTALQIAQENFPTLVALSSTDEMALGLYYAAPKKALGEYNVGPSMNGQPDGLHFETDMPARLTQNRF